MYKINKDDILIALCIVISIIAICALIATPFINMEDNNNMIEIVSLSYDKETNLVYCYDKKENKYFLYKKDDNLYFYINGELVEVKINGSSE